jgi:hypothetical protein
MTKRQENCNRKCCTVSTPENHTLFKNYENRIFEAFSHVSVVNDNYMFLFIRILKKIRMPEFLESLIKFKINIIKNGYTSWSLPNDLQDGNYKLMLVNITLRYFLTNKRYQS